LTTSASTPASTPTPRSWRSPSGCSTSRSTVGYGSTPVDLE